ncbi:MULTISPECIES: type II secretion system F family protein [unclassified Parvimonas]|jgi:Flp pilus assembly protein TadB|uniref:type II secretion system F family protein n=1 Tax=unclassified Parvimonas TaxID=1151464 RepID=UPI002B499B9D|nr:MULTISPECIES: type II secretion system F family protein [unclassified Parvimonas]MEB3024438.1 type II secretion system F family protein [Parvimonas sp. M13]MEB3072485.1 type II secretion system F family protein [Parvimonas sp. C2]MEB3088732.1 type II secretion system F family protein [Parvimonas sp. M20]
MVYIIVLLSGLCVYSSILLLLGEKASRVENIRKRINKAGKENRIKTDDFYENVPFAERVIKPIVDFFIKAVSDMFPSSKEVEDETYQTTLLQAGIRMKARDYYILKLLVVVLFAIIGGFYSKVVGLRGLFGFLFGGIFGAIIGYLFMTYLLRRRIRIRKENMERQFPEFLDLLSVCIEAGLGFDQAIQYVVGEYKSELSDEFRIVMRDISLGSTRKQALLKLQERCLVEQVKTFNAAIIQADEMGISLKKILSAQSYNARQARKRKVEEEIQRLPIKILFPMLIFIFPVIFIVLLLPAGLSIIKSLTSTGLFS